MFSIFLPLLLFVGQVSHYAYPSENAVFRETPAFVLTFETPKETPKTTKKSPEIRKPDPVRERPRPLRIDPGSIVAPLVNPISPEIRTESPPKVPVQRKEEKKIFETVYFEFDSFELRPSEKVKLDALSREAIYSVSGFTCDIGGKEYNDRLAFKRAMAVKEYLGDIVKEVNAKGKCCYMDPKERSKNRRAEIKSITR